jgi:cytochrome c-type biogenesis protein CcmH
MNRLLATCIAYVAFCASAVAVTPDEILSDPGLEERARLLGRELRCVVCQNQSIDDSNAALAHDLRVLLRERLTAGDSDAAAIDYIAARYGDFVLLAPPLKTATALLWAGPALFLFGAFAHFLRLLRRAPPAPTPLSALEEKRLATLLDKRVTK